jgi:hypothetical protein
MIGYPWGALITGILLCFSGILCLVRHFLLEPNTKHYPKAPVLVRHAMFGFAGICLFLGLQYIWVFFMDNRTSVPPQPGPAIQLLSIALVIYKTALLGNILSQRYPAQIWERLNRINEALRCKNKTTMRKWLPR